jgi:hypothetical protein
MRKSARRTAATALLAAGLGLAGLAAQSHNPYPVRLSAAGLHQTAGSGDNDNDQGDQTGGSNGGGGAGGGG